MAGRSHHRDQDEGEPTMRTPRSAVAAAAVTALGLALGGGAAVLAHDAIYHVIAPPDALAISHAVVTGDGDHTFQSIPNWCKLPEGKPTLGPTHGGIVEDKNGNIYFTMDGGPVGIYVYKRDGSLVRTIGDDKLTGIHGLNINEEDGEQFLYAARAKFKDALKLKLDGTVVWQMGFDKVKESGKYPDEKTFVPTGIAVGPDGSVYLADGYGSNWLHKFDKDLKYLSSFGGPGTDPGQFKTCHGIGVDKRGDKPLLLICDRENRRLQHFDLDGKFVAVVAENLRRPCALSFHDKHVAVAELEGRVTILDGNNKEVAHLGDNPDKGQWANYGVAPTDWKPGIFTAPHGVSFDAAGDVYVMDWNASGRVSKFKHLKGAQPQAAARATATPAVAK
jgi:DNA-binding beta-propeller fold protein YncE